MSASSGWLGNNWTEGQRAWFYTACQVEQRDEVVGVLLALFLGSFGAHHFYLRRTGLGVLYLLFFWTGIPALVSFVECFLMPGRVRRYNWYIAQSLLGCVPAVAYAVPPSPVALLGAGEAVVAGPPATLCRSCSSAMAVGARFCRTCGAAAH